MIVEVWSDVACPWCYIGKRRLEAALAGFDRADEVEVQWRAFELDPNAAKTEPGAPPMVERLAKKYGTSPDQAKLMIDRVASTAAKDGLALAFDKVQPGNTFDAHRVIRFAGESGKRAEMNERVFRAYFIEGAAVGDPAVLQALAVEVGLDGDEVAALLAGDRFAAEIRSEEREARELGITGVPFFVIDRKLGVSGAQPAEVLRDAIRTGMAEAQAAAPAPR